MRLKSDGFFSAVLALSVGCNLFFAGWLLGDRVQHFGPPPPFLGPGRPGGPGGPNPPWGPPPPEAMRAFVERMSSSLSPEGARIFTELTDKLHARARDHHQRMMGLREQVEGALVSEPFDEMKLQAALSALQADRATESSATDREVTSAMAKLSPDDRKRLARSGSQGRGLPFPFLHF